MTNFFRPLTPITDFRKLGTGRKRNKVVVVSGEKRILFISEVRRNHDCHREVGFGNRKTFYMDSQTVDGQKVELFLWTERLQDEWCKQSEIDSIDEWMKVMFSRHIFALLECVGDERGIATRKYKGKIFKETAKWEIRRHLEFLSLVELRRITGLFVNSDF
jgi:hypothetical protein